MKKMIACLMLALVGATALGSSAFAAQRLPPGEIEPPLPLPRPRPRPPGGCQSQFEERKSIDFPLYEQGGGLGANGSFSVGMGGSFGVVGDCTHLGADARLNITTKVGPLNMKPFETRLGLNTYNTGRNALELSFLTFGFTIDTIPLYETTDPITYIESHNLVVPAVNTGGSWTKSLDVFGGTASLQIAWESVAIGGAWFIIRVNSSKVEARVLASGDAHASFRVTGRYRRGDAIDLELNQTASLYLFWFSSGGRAVLHPVNNQWQAEAAHSTSWRDVLGGSIVLDLIIDDLTLFSLTPRQGYSEGEVVRPFTKGF